MENAFINAYFEIDQTLRGTITKAQLLEYRERKNYDDAFVEKWLRLFDRKKTGIITLEEFCDVLGLEVKKIHERHASRLKAMKGHGNTNDSDSTWPPRDLEILSVDMREEDQKRVVTFAREAMKKFSSEKEMSEYVHQMCEKEWGQLWHVVILRGEYWSNTQHQPFFNFHFRLANRYIFLTWRTPFM